MTGRASLVRLAVAYWAVVFAAGFVLGTVRTLWLAPAWGELAAVAAELPVMLGASWWWATRLLRRHPAPSRLAALAMGVMAFTLLLASELALAITIAGQSGAQWLTALAAPAGLLGLAGQVLFALIPAVRWPGPGRAG